MFKIRYGVFETNSSSVHSLIMCSDDEYKRFMNNELFYSRWSDAFISRKEALDKLYAEVRADEIFRNVFDLPEGFSRAKIDAIPIEELGTYLYEEVYILTSDYLFNGSDFEYETYNDEYTTANGEVIHAFGYYGHD